MLTLWKTLVLPIVEYCSILWSPTRICDIQALEQLQWPFIRKIYGTSNLSYWDCLKRFNMYSLQRRRERYAIIYLWKILEGIVPNINDNIVPTYNDRLGRRICIVSHNNTLKQQQVTGIGVSLFNSMPMKIRNTSSVNVTSFKEVLDEFLLQVPDEPHIPGTTQRRHKTNCLVDVIKTWTIDRGRALDCSS